MLAVIVGLAGTLMLVQFAAAATYPEYVAAQVAANEQRVKAGSLPDRIWTESDWNSLGSARQEVMMRTLKSDVPAFQAAEDAKKRAETPVDCNASLWSMGVGGAISCAFMSIMSALGNLFIVIFGQLLWLAAAAFDLLVKYVIVGFGATLEEFGIIDGIHTGWQALRDLANIVIIGMFVFIAISMILGNENFGTKKLVAHVLIIAVLINFSLLFAKLIIDGSNFAAAQFYKAIPRSDEKDYSPIGNKIVEILGITSAWGNYELVKKYGESVKKAGEEEAGGKSSTWNSFSAGIKAFAYGLIIGVFLLAAAIVFFYGAALIAARAVELILLMLISALAFATWLIPKYTGSDFGWTKWWERMINNAIFAPLLMALIALTLNIMLPTLKKRQGSFADIAIDPSKLSEQYSIFLIYIFTIGMLFASIKIASSFASSSASKFAGFATGKFLGTAAFGGSALLGGPGLAARWAGRGMERVPGFKTLGRGLGSLGVTALQASKYTDVRRMPGFSKAVDLASMRLGKARTDGLHDTFDKFNRGLGKMMAERDKLAGRPMREDTKKDLAGEAAPVRQTAAAAPEKSPEAQNAPAQQAGTPTRAAQEQLTLAREQRAVSDQQQALSRDLAARQTEGTRQQIDITGHDQRIQRIAQDVAGIVAAQTRQAVAEAGVSTAAAAGEQIAKGMEPTARQLEKTTKEIARYGKEALGRRQAERVLERRGSLLSQIFPNAQKEYKSMMGKTATDKLLEELGKGIKEKGNDPSAFFKGLAEKTAGGLSAAAGKQTEAASQLKEAAKDVSAAAKTPPPAAK